VLGGVAPDGPAGRTPYQSVRRSSDVLKEMRPDMRMKPAAFQQVASSEHRGAAAYAPVVDRIDD
jgi:hypothetical protein